MVFWLLHQNKLKNNTGTLAILVDIDIFSMCVWAIIQSEYLFILFLISTKGIFGAQWWLRWKIPVRNNNQNTIAYKKMYIKRGFHHLSQLRGTVHETIHPQCNGQKKTTTTNTLVIYALLYDARLLMIFIGNVLCIAIRTLYGTLPNFDNV